MKRTEHAESCEAAFGKPFAEVHDFLDRYSPRFPRIHRILYHHRRGVERIVERFGPEAAKAAERHITEDEGFVPEDPTHYRTDDPELLRLLDEIYSVKGQGAGAVMPGDGVDWKRVTTAAPWQARDSQAQAVFRDRLWIMGGWFSSYEPCPRDVWSSPDGREWECVTETAPWKHGDLAMSLVFRDKLWFLGGWHNGRLPGHSASGEVWCSADGADWECRTRAASWSPRLASGAVVFCDRMWLLGGIRNYFFGTDADLLNDVWASEDGGSWTLVAADAPWSPRAFHQAVVFDGKIWVMGGGNYVPRHHARNDVWCSEDGENWELATDAAPWGPRLWFRTVVYRDRMWVLGGWCEATDNYGDVWHSKDGVAWERLETETIWKARHEHAAWVFDDRLIVAGGHARPLSNEVWSLHLHADWAPCR